MKYCKCVGDCHCIHPKEPRTAEEWATLALDDSYKNPGRFWSEIVLETVRRAQEQATEIENARCAEFYERKAKVMVEQVRREAIEECLGQFPKGDQDIELWEIGTKIHALLEKK
jgi:hypothetical protein